MATLRGAEAARFQLPKASNNVRDFKKYRDAAPQVISDEVIHEIIQKNQGNETAIFSAIQDLWHDISDERAVQGNEWETTDKNKKNKKRQESVPTREEKGGRGRGRSAPPGRGGDGRGPRPGRGLSSGRDRADGGRGGLRNRPQPYNSNSGAVPESQAEASGEEPQYENTEQPTEWGDVAAEPEAVSEQTVVLEEYQQAKPGTSKSAWMSGGVSFVQHLKMKEEQQQRAAALAAQKQQQLIERNQQQQQEKRAVEGQHQEGSDGEGRSQRSKSKRTGASRSGNRTRSRGGQEDSPSSPQEETALNSEDASEQIPLQSSSSGGLNGIELHHSLESLTSLSEAISHISDNSVSNISPALPSEPVAVSVQPVVIEVSPLSAPSHSSVDPVSVSNTSSSLLENSPKPYLKLGKWDAPIETTPFQFGSFGSFADDTSSSAPSWNVTETSDITEDNMSPRVWSAVSVPSDSSISAAPAPSSDSSILERSQVAPGMPRKDLDAAKSQQQTVTSSQGLSQQPLQNQTAYHSQYQQPAPVQAPTANMAVNGAPPGLQHASHSSMQIPTTAPARGAGMQTQSQMPYYSLDVGYMHPGYAPVSAAVAPVGALAASSATTTGTTTTHSAASVNLQQQQQQQQQAAAYPSPPPGMAAMSPYGAAAYNPYFFNQPGYYYGNAMAPNVYGRGGQAMYQAPRGPYVSDPYPQAMGGYPTDIYGQPAMGGQFADSLYGNTMGMHNAQGGQGAVGGGAGTGKGGKGSVASGAPSQAQSTQDHNIGYGYGNANPYTHNSRDVQAAAAQPWSYQPTNPAAWNAQLMPQQPQFPPAGPVGGGFSQPSAMSQSRHDGGGRGQSANPGSYTQSYGGGNRGGVSGGGAGGQSGGNHQTNW